MVIALSILLFVVLVRPFGSPEPNPEIDRVPPVPVPSSADIEIDWPAPPVYAANIADPMASGSEPHAEAETGEIVVRGIVYTEKLPLAIIDEEYYGEGDTIRGATIIKIEPDSVVFEKDGERRTQKVQGKKE
jgi:hypothetical protein